MVFMFDVSVIARNARTYKAIIEALMKDEHQCFVISSGIPSEEVTGILESADISPDSIFVAPFDKEEKTQIAAWKANTARSLSTQMFVDSDTTFTEQARVVGVHSLYTRL
jgi:hypothetical protein